MNYVEQKPPGRRLAGIGVVVTLHLAIAYALVNGLARKAVEAVRGPVETKLVQEVKLPEPPKAEPPPPPKEQPRTPPPPKPAYVPPAEITPPPSPSPAPTISAVTREETRSEPVAAPPAPAPEPPPKPAPEPARAPERTAPVVDAARNCHKPEYPAASRRLEESGTVTLRFLIGVDGRVTESKVEASSGHPRLDEAARDALSRCRFKPGTVDGQPEPSWVSLKYKWVLDN